MALARTPNHFPFASFNSIVSSVFSVGKVKSGNKNT